MNRVRGPGDPGSQGQKEAMVCTYTSCLQTVEISLKKYLVEELPEYKRVVQKQEKSIKLNNSDIKIL